MKQISQSYASGRLRATDVPCPTVKSADLLIRTAASLVSIGTEKAMIDLARKPLLGKALARPDWVKQVLDKARNEGIREAWRQSFARLDVPVALGYASAGIVIAVGRGVTDLKVGNRVACSGSGHASHAEVVAVPRNLCTPIPGGVSFEEASFATVGGIALEAVRMARVELGHRVTVIGLGLLGQLAVQILTAAGCHVQGVDIDPHRTELALAHGAESVVQGDESSSVIAECRAFTRGHGADSVIILASTPSNQPLELAAQVCRERGRVVATGLVGLEIPRKPFYEKELEFVVSRAWGPGLYDEDYETRSVKYPLPYVRWTAQRNMAEFLALVAGRRVVLDKIITHRFPFDRALGAYEMILQQKEPFLGVVLEYPYDKQIERVTRIDLPSTDWRRRTVTSRGIPRNVRAIGIGLIGAGMYARGTLLLALKKVKGLRYVGVATSSGLSGRHAGDKWGFEYCTTDYRQLLDDPDVQAVLVLTRHHSHAGFVCEALRAGKAVFVEKPLALNSEQLATIVRAYKEDSFLMVGYNRRFAPDTTQLCQALSDVQGPFLLHIRANAGYIPSGSWVHHPEEGGGRIIGEVCHFVDLASVLTDSLPVRVHVVEARTSENLRDNLSVSLGLANGSAATIAYASTGARSFPREYVEIFGGGLAATIDNFRGSRVSRGGRTKRRRSLGIDRGHGSELRAFFDCLRRGQQSPVHLRDYVATTLTTFAIERSLTRKEPVLVDVDAFIRQILNRDQENSAEGQ